MGRPGETSLGIRRESKLISKVQEPKIRVIHIFTPEIINTDVKNFRKLVQRLTGKPNPSSTSSPKKDDGGRKSTEEAKAAVPKNNTITTWDHDDHEQQSTINLISERPITIAKKDDDEEDTQHQQAVDDNNSSTNNSTRIGGSTGGNNVWRTSGDYQESTTDLLSAFQDIDGLMQVFGELPYVPSDVSSHVTTFGDSQIYYS